MATAISGWFFISAMKSQRVIASELGVFHGADGRGAREPFEERHLAEEVAGAEAGEHRAWSLPARDGLGLAFADDEEAGRLVVLLDDRLAGLDGAGHHQLGQAFKVALAQLGEQGHAS